FFRNGRVEIIHHIIWDPDCWHGWLPHPTIGREMLTRPRAGFVMIKTEFIFGRLEAFFDPPA
ncbi:hypothetical protein, partial [Acetobacter fabarum]|uniref:hypothetical protein n=1 Tax=Acetobacter fabarum TaxID=483199 RepID=UPI001C52DB51